MCVIAFPGIKLLESGHNLVDQILRIDVCRTRSLFLPLIAKPQRRGFMASFLTRSSTSLACPSNSLSCEKIRLFVVWLVAKRTHRAIGCLKPPGAEIKCHVIGTFLIFKSSRGVKSLRWEGAKTERATHHEENERGRVRIILKRRGVMLDAVFGQIKWGVVSHPDHETFSSGSDHNAPFEDAYKSCPQNSTAILGLTQF